MKRKWKNTCIWTVIVFFVVVILYNVHVKEKDVVNVKLTKFRGNKLIPNLVISSGLPASIETVERTQTLKENIKYEKDIYGNSEHIEMLADVNVTSNCTGIVFPVRFNTNDNWNPVDTGNDGYTFSAYLNIETRDVVIVGAQTQLISVQFCQFWYELDNNHVYMEESSAETVILPEGRGLRYTAALFLCKCPSSKMPTYISLVTKSCEKPLNLIKLHSINSGTTKRKFTVCLMPLNFNYSRDFELIEWIELNRILGAEKFVVYNYSSADNVKKVLKYYSERGLAEVVQWQLPMGVDTFPKENKPIEIYYFAQVAAMQDCLYRNQIESEFIVNIDVDEFIVPHSKDIYTWDDMLKSFSNISAAFLFRNVFFRKDWNNTKIPTNKMAGKLKLVSLQKVEHETNVFLPKQRSKYIARTSDVSRLMIHEVSGILNGKQLETVPLEIGFLHHYRNWEIYDDPPSSERISDTTVPDKFGKNLINRVKQVWTDLGMIQDLTTDRQ